jgi:hypothetical protein
MWRPPSRAVTSTSPPNPQHPSLLPSLTSIRPRWGGTVCLSQQAARVFRLRPPARRFLLPQLQDQSLANLFISLYYYPQILGRLPASGTFVVPDSINAGAKPNGSSGTQSLSGHRRGDRIKWAPASRSERIQKGTNERPIKPGNSRQQPDAPKSNRRSTSVHRHEPTPLPPHSHSSHVPPVLRGRLQLQLDSAIAGTRDTPGHSLLESPQWCHRQFLCDSRAVRSDG